MSNASLYAITPPAYAVEAAENEISIEAQDVDDRKSAALGPEESRGEYEPSCGAPVVQAASREDDGLARGPWDVPISTGAQGVEVDETRSPVSTRDQGVEGDGGRHVLRRRPLPVQTDGRTNSFSLTGTPPVYLPEATAQVALAHARKCCILTDYPAVWIVKGKRLALSPLAATVLVKEGILAQKDLEL